jgi:hypothetical protein
VTQYAIRPPGYDHDIAIDFAWPGVKLAIEVDHPAGMPGQSTRTPTRVVTANSPPSAGRPPRITDIDVSSGLREAVRMWGDPRSSAHRCRLSQRLLGRYENCHVENRARGAAEAEVELSRLKSPEEVRRRQTCRNRRT